METLPAPSLAAPPRQFSEIAISELPEVLAVATDSLNPEADVSTWDQILSTLDATRTSRVAERHAWSDRLTTLEEHLETLRSTHPRLSAQWKTSLAHQEQLAAHGQRTLELAKQIAKLESQISRVENEVRECREAIVRLRQRDAGEGDGEGEEEEEEEGDEGAAKNSLALTMFRQLGFQPAAVSSTNAPPRTIFARSDAKGKVTPFHIAAQLDDARERARIANAMWDAVE